MSDRDQAPAESAGPCPLDGSPNAHQELHRPARHDARRAARFKQDAAAPPQRVRAARGGARNVVLVHGAYADGSSWSEVIRRLQAAGIHARAVQNPLP